MSVRLELWDVCDRAVVPFPRPVDTSESAYKIALAAMPKNLRARHQRCLETANMIMAFIDIFEGKS
jgi:hypothetical protein